MNLKEAKREILQIKARNKRVELDKAWELSFSRKILVMIFTYFAIGIYLWAIKIPQPWLNAIVPTVAFMLSTLTMPFFKKWWATTFYKK
jgi:hypothetical protein